MLSSRDIDRLRPDVAANCRRLIALCGAAGHPVLVTGTVRDEAYQLRCYQSGTSRSKVPTFHSVKAGLAFDICKNVRGQEYSDPAFWAEVSAIGKGLGFTWGGDWKTMVDKPHFQWDAGGRYTAKMILAGQYPPEMPAYEEESHMTQEQFNQMMDAYLAQRAKLPPSDWSAEARAWAEARGVICGDGQGNMQYQGFVTREQLVTFLKRSAEGSRTGELGAE